MVSFPNAKINLGLSVLSKRTDGFHDLETVFYPLQLTDIIEIIESEIDFQFASSGLQIEGNENDNICIKAYQLLKKDFPLLPAMQMHLHKVIPMGAGLGGGSADGTFMLQLINKKFSLDISHKKLQEYSLQLGSDCPFFLINKPCFARGRGEFLELINPDLSAYKFLIIVPPVHVNTGWAFTQLNIQTGSGQEGKIKEAISAPAESWKNLLTNDFEKVVFSAYPEIKLIKEKLYDKGAVYASMSGSGSAVFGIFKKESVIRSDFPENYFIKELIC